MTKAATRIPISDIILDEEIYPRSGVDQKRVGIFAENIRDGFKFDPIEVQTHPDLTGKYRILDGVHRWSAYKAVGTAEPEVIIKNLDGIDPLLYAAKKAIGPRQLSEEETRETADCREIEDSTYYPGNSFDENARIGKFVKSRFIERLYSCPSC
jgi:hypothetical protein